MIQFGQSESEKAIGSRRAAAGERKRNEHKRDSSRRGQQQEMKKSKIGFTVLHLLLLSSPAAVPFVFISFPFSCYGSPAANCLFRFALSQLDHFHHPHHLLSLGSKLECLRNHKTFSGPVCGVILKPKWHDDCARCVIILKPMCYY